MIGPFTGEYSFLSNFSAHSVAFGNTTFPTVEHYYQASKAATLDGFQLVASARTPAEAKRTGRRVAMRSGFEDRKRGIMLAGVTLKFLQHPEIGKLLAATGDEHLEEINTWGDTYWGTVNGTGSNWLGRILMMVRETLRLKTPRLANSTTEPRVVTPGGVKQQQVRGPKT